MTHKKTWSKRIREYKPFSGLKIISIKTMVKDIVTVKGSFRGGYVMHSYESGAVSELVVRMLEEGSNKKNKEMIRDIIDSRGAKLEFYTTPHFVGFFLQCLRKDLPTIATLIGEMFREPAFPKNEFKILKHRRLAELKALNKDPAAMARAVLTQTLYPANHPNYINNPLLFIKKISRVKISDLKDFHRSIFGLGTFNIVLAGDVSDKETRAFARALRGFKISKFVNFPNYPKPLIIKKNITKTVFIKDKTSAILSIGQTTKVTKKSSDYYALIIGIAVLAGDGFSARLMARVRDQQGLTYGVYGWLNGISGETPGYFNVTGTFAPSLLERGQHSVLKEIRTWAEKGITMEELKRKKENFIGTFKIDLSTTKGLAEEILRENTEGENKTFIDEFPKLIEKITLKEVNAAIRRHINPGKFVIVRSGTIK